MKMIHMNTFITSNQKPAVKELYANYYDFGQIVFCRIKIFLPIRADAIFSNYFIVITAIRINFNKDSSIGVTSHG